MSSFKVGITNNVKSRLSAIERDFGKVRRAESLIYSCYNRKLLENIEHGIHAYLNNYSYSPKLLGGGSTEWFSIHAMDIAKEFIDLFLNELDEFNLEDSLVNYLQQPINYEDVREDIDKSINFLDIHSTAINNISDFINEYKTDISVEKREGEFVIISENLDKLTIHKLPLFQWVKKAEKELIFDIKVFNKWKKSGSQNVIRGLVEIKFFSDFKWSNFESMF